MGPSNKTTITMAAALCLVAAAIVIAIAIGISGSEEGTEKADGAWPPVSLQGRDARTADVAEDEEAEAAWRVLDERLRQLGHAGWSPQVEADDDEKGTAALEPVEVPQDSPNLGAPVEPFEEIYGQPLDDGLPDDVE